MVLELNEYVRTKNGIIAKVIGVQSGGIEKYFFDKEVHNLFNYLNGLVVENVVIKHSFNIIDLIEKGDYVNELKIIDINGICNDKKTKAFTIYKNKGKAIITFLKNEEIRSIVTKEQFEAMEYVIREE